MKNQCPYCIRKRTMKMQTRIILIACFVIMIFNNFGISVKVSSKVDLDSNENEGTLDNPTFTILNSQKSNSPESILRASNPSTLIWRQGNEFVEPRKRIYTWHEDSAKQPKIINNIQVVVNSNDSVPIENSCKYGICNVSIFSKSDKKGNIITEVYFSIITKAKPNVKIDDVPVIKGFRGINEDYDKRPIFHSINSPRSIDAHLYFNNIPQIQSNYHGYGEPWYGRTFRQPQMYWNSHFRNHGNVRFRGHEKWIRDRPIVDDKIEPPLSKTKSSDDK